MKKGRWEDKQMTQVLAEMPKNAEVALGGERTLQGDISGESLTVQHKEGEKKKKKSF